MYINTLATIIYSYFFYFSINHNAMQPHIVVFSSSESYAIAEGITSHLKKDFVVHPWKGEFFGENKTTPIWTFFKKLFYYDYAIIILSDDKIAKAVVEGEPDNFYPKDNVLFELGASMARLGPQKTILLIPESPLIKLPGYFDDAKPSMFTFKKLNSVTDNLIATADAAQQIKLLIEAAGLKNFHSELPAQGLAHAYLLNFLKPVTESGFTQVLHINGVPHEWTPETGMTFTIIIPDEIMGRNKANDFFQNRSDCFNTLFKARDGRDPSVYVLPRNSADDILHILDIPTTLLTAEDIISNIETFWRETDHEKIHEVDNEFISSLRDREILNFRRTLEQAVAKLQTKIYIVSASELDIHLANL